MSRTPRAAAKPGTRWRGHAAGVLVQSTRAERCSRATDGDGLDGTKLDACKAPWDNGTKLEP